jgi:hypothetical protein
MYYRGLSKKVSGEETNYFIPEKDSNAERALICEKSFI